ncbi:hypothetical protein DPEC_G00254010 [Dallia pectoralis]|uniref:Uncharacterized protein n=1 Tax=Dallia pectoralis TaxID=75939 RepID=A0ACC2FUA7_DALPE|nr:hypothetical protein DPEC_G00254010 [Dallia pectoralis]
MDGSNRRRSQSITTDSTFWPWISSYSPLCRSCHSAPTLPRQLVSPGARPVERGARERERRGEAPARRVEGGGRGDQLFASCMPAEP